MSNLNSIFDTLRGWPDGSALEASFEPAYATTIPEGTVVAVSSRELAPASVLKIVDDTLVAAPTLAASDRGLAYAVAGVGGAWATFDIGDIVEWDGLAWHVIVAAVEAEVADGTRAVVTDATAAGSFTGLEQEVVQYTKETIELVNIVGVTYTSCVPGDIGLPVVATGSGDTGHLLSYDNATRTWIVDPDTPADVFAHDDILVITGGTGHGKVDTATPTVGAWTDVVPDDGARIKIVGAGSVFENKFYDYLGTHPAGVWGKSARQIEAPAVIAPLTSIGKNGHRKDHAWMVIQGNDQFDGQFTNKLTCLKCQSGFVAKVACAAANTLVPADYVVAVGGLLVKQAAGGGIEWPVGQVLQSNGVAGATGWVVIATY